MLDRFKFVFTKDHLAKLKDILNNIDVDTCSRERMKKRTFYKLEILTVFAV